MKIGLLADIHADLNGLQRALALLDTHGVDRILCAGDLVEKGMEGDAVVALLRERDIPSVMGNHDDRAPNRQRELRQALALDPAHPDAPFLLTKATLLYLLTLPHELRCEWENTRVLVVHGTPASNEEYLFDITPSARFRYIAHSSAADIIVCGHTHEPMQVRERGVLFLNPGSVCGMDANYGSHSCAVLELPARTVRWFDIGTGAEIQVERG